VSSSTHSLVFAALSAISTASFHILLALLYDSTVHFRASFENSDVFWINFFIFLGKLYAVFANSGVINTQSITITVSAGLSSTSTMNWSGSFTNWLAL